VASEPEKSEIQKLTIDRLTKVANSSTDVDVAKEAVNILSSYGDAALLSLFTIAEEANSNFIKWLALRRIHEVVEARTVAKE